MGGSSPWWGRAWLTLTPSVRRQNPNSPLVLSTRHFLGQSVQLFRIDLRWSIFRREIVSVFTCDPASLNLYPLHNVSDLFAFYKLQEFLAQGPRTFHCLPPVLDPCGWIIYEDCKIVAIRDFASGEFRNKLR